MKRLIWLSLLALSCIAVRVYIQPAPVRLPCDTLLLVPGDSMWLYPDSVFPKFRPNGLPDNLNDSIWRIPHIVPDTLWSDTLSSEPDWRTLCDTVYYRRPSQ